MVDQILVPPSCAPSGYGIGQIGEVLVALCPDCGGALTSLTRVAGDYAEDIGKAYLCAFCSKYFPGRQVDADFANNWWLTQVHYSMGNLTLWMRGITGIEDLKVRVTH